MSTGPGDSASSEIVWEFNAVLKKKGEPAAGAAMLTIQIMHFSFVTAAGRRLIRVRRSERILWRQLKLAHREGRCADPNVHVYNLNLQRELWWDTLMTIGYAGSRGIHLLRNAEVNIPEPLRLADGSAFYPANAPRPNAAFGTIELKKSDGNSWYNAMIVEVRKSWSRGFEFQSSYTLSQNIDTTQASTFFSDATNGTTSAMPEPPGSNYNKGLADFHSKHNWIVNFDWELPFAKRLTGTAAKLLDGWQLLGIWQMRSGNPLTDWR